MSELQRLIRERAGEPPAVDAGTLESVRSRAAARRRRRKLSSGLLALSLTGLLVLGLAYAVRDTNSSPAGPADDTFSAHGVVLGGVSSGDQFLLLVCSAPCPEDLPVGSAEVIALTETLQAAMSLQFQSAVALDASDGLVGVASMDPARITAVDQSTGDVRWSRTLDSERRVLPVDIDVGEQAIWVLNSWGTAIQLSPTDGAILSTVDLHSRDGSALLANDGFLWVAENLDGVERVDPANPQNSVIVPILDGDNRLSVDSIAAGDGGIWVAGMWGEPQTDKQGTDFFEATGESSLAWITSDGKVQIVTSSVGPAFVTTDGSVAWFVADDGKSLFRVGNSSVAATVPEGDRIVGVFSGSAVVQEGNQSVRLLGLNS